jgi:hypothetical protein
MEQKGHTYLKKMKFYHWIIRRAKKLKKAVEKQSYPCPLVSSCEGWDCSSHGSFCPPDVKGSRDFGYCCVNKMWTSAGNNHECNFDGSTKKICKASSSDFNENWKRFISNVVRKQGSCSNELLQNVKVDNSGKIYFDCSKSRSLCICIQHVRRKGEEQHFVVGKIGLKLFRQENGFVKYRITEREADLAYGDVNKKKLRRRLLGPAGGNS